LSSSFVGRSIVVRVDHTPEPAQWAEAARRIA
jgi:hypothetical protein